MESVIKAPIAIPIIKGIYFCNSSLPFLRALLQTAKMTHSSFASGDTYDDGTRKGAALREVRCGEEMRRCTLLEGCRIKSLLYNL